MAIENGITNIHPSYSQNKNRWKLCRDAIAGQDIIKQNGFKYLPPVNPTDLEKEEDYQIYLENAEYFNAIGLTFDAFVGMIFRKDPQIGEKDRVANLENPLLANVNLEGDSIYTFIEDILDEELTVGRIGILNDYPKVDEIQELTVNEAAAAGIRPYVAYYTAESIINWKYKTIKNVKKTISVVLQEQVERAVLTEGDELFSHDMVSQYRALVILGNGFYHQIVYNENLSEVSRDIIIVKGEPLTEIPFTVINTNSLGLEIDKPPLLDMANTNISHYRASAALGANLHMFARVTPIFTVPIEFYDKFMEQDMEFGSTRSIVIPSSSEGGESSAKFLEPASDFVPIVNQQLRLEERMAAQGARMLTTGKKGVEAPDTVRLDMMGELSILSKIVKNLNVGLSEVFTRMLGTETKIILNSDFLSSALDAGTISSLLMSVQAGRISNAQFVDSMIRGEAVKQEKDIITDTNITSEPDLEAVGVPAANGELKGREENTRNAEPLSGPNGLENT